MRVPLVMLLVSISTIAMAAPPASVQDLASALAAPRDACAQQAQRAASDANTANYKAGLDLQNAQLQAELDARVYSVGHGRTETRDFLLERTRQTNADSIATTQRIADKLHADSQAVLACVADAKAQGKNLYSTFKADRRHRRDMPEAEALMTAWLTNVAEISTDQPQGSDESLAGWKKAKAHTEVAGL